MKTKKEVILGTLSLCMYLNACSTLENKEGNLDNVVDEISTQAKKSEEVVQEKGQIIKEENNNQNTKPIEKPTKNKPQLFNVINSYAKENTKPEFSYIYNDYYYYYFKLGQMSEVVLNPDSHELFKIKEGDPKKTYGFSQKKVETTSMETATRNVTGESFEVETSKTTSESFGVEKTEGSSSTTKLNLGLEASYKAFELGFSRTLEVGVEMSKNSSSTTSQQFANENELRTQATNYTSIEKSFSNVFLESIEIEKKVEFEFGENSKPGFWYFSLLGIFDLYAFICFDPVEGKVIEYDTTSRLLKSYYDVIYCADDMYAYKTINDKVNIDLDSFLYEEPNLELFDIGKTIKNGKGKIEDINYNIVRESNGKYLMTLTYPRHKGYYQPKSNDTNTRRYGNMEYEYKTLKTSILNDPNWVKIKQDNYEVTYESISTTLPDTINLSGEYEEMGEFPWEKQFSYTVYNDSYTGSAYPLGTRTEGWYVYAFPIGAWGDVSVCDVNYGENTIHSSKPGRTVLGNNNYLKGWYKSGEIGYTEDGDLYLHFTEWWDFFTTGVGGGNKKARNCDDWWKISNSGGYNIHKLDRTSLNDLAKKSSVTWIAVDSPNKALRHYEKTSTIVYRWEKQSTDYKDTRKTTHNSVIYLK